MRYWLYYNIFLKYMNLQTRFPLEFSLNRISFHQNIDMGIEYIYQQESPPAWTQEAYRLPCSNYSLCCPNWVPPLARVPPRPGYPPWPRYPPGQGTPPARVPPGQGTPRPGYPPGQGTPPGQGIPLARVPPTRVSPLARVSPRPGYPPGQGTPLGGVPPRPGVPPWPGYPPSCPMAFWEMLQSIMGYGYPPQVWTDKQSETITFPSYYVRGR